MNVYLQRLVSALLILQWLWTPLALQAGETKSYPPPIGLKELERRLRHDFNLLNFPVDSWKKSEPGVYDVVIIGGGMAGMAAGLALEKQGILNFKIYDSNPEGFEGPWLTYARMKILRSHKAWMGPALNIPNLTFRAWFESQYGLEEWERLDKIPTTMWMDYLKWYRKVTKLPIENEWTLQLITPEEDVLHLTLSKGNLTQEVLTHKVVLATGRLGFGGPEIPDFMKKLPKKLYAHTSEMINFDALKGKKVGVIGVGASGWDAAGVALEQGAQWVDILMRRKELPMVYKFSQLSYPGIVNGFNKLFDEGRLDFMSLAFSNGVPPPEEAVQRVSRFTNWKLHPETSIKGVKEKGRQVEVQTSRGSMSFDFIILGTGFTADGHLQPELRLIIDKILLWEDRGIPKIAGDKLKHFPYLGDHFQFLEKESGTAPFLKNIYCFNYGSALSHGMLSSDIPGISYGATRLAEGIAADFFVQDWQVYYKQLEDYMGE